MPPETHLTEEEIEHFHEKLLQRRREIVGDMAQLDEELEEGRSGRPKGSQTHGMHSHPADAAAEQRSEEAPLRLSARERDLVKEIDEAIERIRAGTYGLCLVDRKPISRARLEAKPWARACLEHAEKEEPS